MNNNDITPEIKSNIELLIDEAITNYELTGNKVKIKHHVFISDLIKEKFPDDHRKVRRSYEKIAVDYWTEICQNLPDEKDVKEIVEVKKREKTIAKKEVKTSEFRNSIQSSAEFRCKNCVYLDNKNFCRLNPIPHEVCRDTHYCYQLKTIDNIGEDRLKEFISIAQGVSDTAYAVSAIVDTALNVASFVDDEDE